MIMCVQGILLMATARDVELLLYLAWLRLLPISIVAMAMNTHETKTTEANRNLHSSQESSDHPKWLLQMVIHLGETEGLVHDVTAMMIY